MAVEDEDEDGAQLLAALQADDALLEAATTVTVEQEAQAMAATRERAAEHGVEPKSHGEHGWAGSMRRKFERFYWLVCAVGRVVSDAAEAKRSSNHLS